MCSLHYHARISIVRVHHSCTSWHTHIEQASHQHARLAFCRRPSQLRHTWACEVFLLIFGVISFAIVGLQWSGIHGCTLLIRKSIICIIHWNEKIAMHCHRPLWISSVKHPAHQLPTPKWLFLWNAFFSMPVWTWIFLGTQLQHTCLMTMRISSAKYN